VEAIVQAFAKSANVRRGDITRAVRLGNHPLLLVTFSSTTLRDNVVSNWYKIMHGDNNKFGVREDLTKAQMRQMHYMKPVFNYLRSPAGRVAGARGPFFKHGCLYYHEPSSGNEPLLHPANYDPHQVPTPLRGELEGLRAQLWPGCSLRDTPAAAVQRRRQP
jgi:hypothetical protein